MELGLVRVPVLLVCPGFAGFQGVFPFKIGKALNGFSLFPREFEIDVLKLVVKTDLTGIRESGAEIHPINSRPIANRMARNKMPDFAKEKRQRKFKGELFWFDSAKPDRFLDLLQ
jgi:hypothetical protein